MFKKVLVPVIAVVFLVGFLSACNTIEGVGKDVEKGGKAVKDTANESK